MSDTKKILITGGAGFIGSNFIHYLLHKYPSYQVLDKLTYAGNLENLDNIPSFANDVFIKGDICNSDLLNKIFSEYRINSVINFAAESHVDNSIKNPEEFIKTNVLGTFTLLNTAKTFWQNKIIENT